MSDLLLTDGQRALRDEVRSFAHSRVAPLALQRSRDSAWDPQLWREIGSRRWPGVLMPTELDGMGRGALEHAIIVEELCHVDASVGGGQNLVQQALMALLSFGTDEHRARYVPPIARGEAFTITAITESRAGSKVSDMETFARREGGEWVMDGVKSEVHLPEYTQICLVLAKTEEGVSAFLVDTVTPGFKVLRAREAIGMRAMSMAEIGFEQCRLPAENLIGVPGRGLDVFFKSFELSRVGNAAKAVGISQGALDRAIAYARERRIGDGVVTDFQGIRWQIAQFASRIAACRLLTYAAAAEYDRVGRSPMTSLQAKLLACELAMEVTTFALQLTGSHGCFVDEPFMMYMLDAKVGQLTGGSLEIAKNGIARNLLGKETRPAAVAEQA